VLEDDNFSFLLSEVNMVDSFTTSSHNIVVFRPPRQWFCVAIIPTWDAYMLFQTLHNDNVDVSMTNNSAID